MPKAADPTAVLAAAQKMTAAFAAYSKANEKLTNVHFTEGRTSVENAEDDRRRRQARRADRRDRRRSRRLLVLGLLSRSIVGRVKRYAAFADRVAQRDLDDRLETKGRDEIDDLAASLNSMVDGLDEVAGAAGRVADGRPHGRPDVAQRA